jgi:hypothetical protein
MPLRRLAVALLAACSATTAGAEGSAACLSALVTSCGLTSSQQHKSCGVCAGHQQHELREAGCTAADIRRYCGDGAATPLRGRGVGDGKSQHPDDMQLLSGLGWWYNWGLSPDPSSTTGPAQEFVAMAWGGQHKHEPLKKYLEDWTPHHSTKHLLGFNEPNLRHQSNLSAAAACRLWPEMLSAAKQHGMSLGSPAANHCTPGGSGSQDSNCFLAPEDWFDAFFAQPGCGLETVDFIATHKCARTAAAAYWALGGATHTGLVLRPYRYGCNATATIQYVMMLHARYQKPM